MRRIILLLAVAAMIAAMMAEAGPAGAAAREPTLDGPGAADQHLPDDTVADTKPAGKNCYGQAASNHVSGPGGDPGSIAVPTEFPEGTPNYTGHAVSTLDDAFGQDSGEDPGGEISAVQESARDTLAGAENCEPTDRQ